jgi:predicted DsbA family dithiol-disulfide isomerase
MSVLTIDVVSDVICPWCYLGKRRLEQALALVPEIKTQVRWHPFMLDPTIPAQGVDRAEYMRAKFDDEDRLQQIHLHLKSAGAESGLDYQFDKITRTPNTMDAHRLIRWAGEADLQGEMVEELFRRYWIDGEDIGNHGILTMAAIAVGMDGDATHARLHHDDGIAEVREEVEMAQKIGVTGVPTYIIAGQYGISGAQDPAELARAMREIYEKAESQAAK